MTFSVQIRNKYKEPVKKKNIQWTQTAKLNSIKYLD